MAKSLVTTKRMYQTAFPATANPISEGGIWINGAAIGLDWKDIQTAGNLAYGQQDGSGNYDDSIAIRNGTWAADQAVEAIVYSANRAVDANKEVELLLRRTTVAHSASGYEINFNTSTAHQYCEIIKWNGPYGDFTPIVHNTSTPTVQNGDVIKATIIGNTITAYVNGVQVMQHSILTDINGNSIAAINSGAPGIGHFLHNLGGTGNNADFGLKFARCWEV